jgi:hypothetical protein
VIDKENKSVALQLADELINSNVGWRAATELRKLHDLLGKANALCRIRLDRIEKLETENKFLQSKLDALMLEFCPEEMTEEQINEWKTHQKVVK